jgi:hypothetical protein
VTEAKKFRYATFRSASACWSTTADTSPSQARSGVALAAVSWADSSALVIRPPFVERGLSGVQPVIEDHPGTAERLAQGGALARGWIETVAVPKLHIDIIFDSMRNIGISCRKLIVSCCSRCLRIGPVVHRCPPEP